MVLSGHISTSPSDLLQVVSTIDAAIDKFKRNPVPLEMQAGAPQHQAPYQHHPTAGATAVPGAYQDPQTAYPATAGATAPYAEAVYIAAPYSQGQYGAYPQQPYQQPYAAAAAQGKSLHLKAALPKNTNPCTMKLVWLPICTAQAMAGAHLHLLFMAIPLLVMPVE